MRTRQADDRHVQPTRAWDAAEKDASAPDEMAIWSEGGGMAGCVSRRLQRLKEAATVCFCVPTLEYVLIITILIAVEILNINIRFKTV